MDCSITVEYENDNVCRFTKSYAEGSSLFGMMGFDYLKFKDSQKMNDSKLLKLNPASIKDL